MNRSVIADHIKDIRQREDYQNGESGKYEISGLDFLVFGEECDFDDGNDYTFSGCKIRNRKIRSSGFITFDECKLDGIIEIINMDPDCDMAEMLCVRMQKCVSTNQLFSLKISSPMIDYIGNNITTVRRTALIAINSSFRTSFDDMDVFANSVKSYGEITLDFVEAAFESTTVMAPTINIPEYKELLMDYCLILGNINHTRRTVPMRNETLIIDSDINRQNIKEFSSVWQVPGFPSLALKGEEGIRRI